MLRHINMTSQICRFQLQTAMMTSGSYLVSCIRNGIIRSVWFVRSTRVKMKPLFVVMKNAGTVTVSTRSVFMESVIVTDQAGRRRKGTERGGTERKRRDVTSRLAGKKTNKTTFRLERKMVWMQRRGHQDN